MKIVWDEPKRLANLDKHGLDFADLNETFFDNACARPTETKGSAMPNAKNKGYSARDLREVSNSPELTEKDFAKAKPFAEVFRGRGPNKAPTKKLVSLRLSGQVLEAYKAKGPGWQSRIDADLRRINKIK